MKNYSIAELENILKSEDIEKVTNALLYITFNVDDFDWVQEMCINMVNHKDEDVSGLAITCLGHIARIHSKISRKKVIPVLEEKAKDSKFTGRVEDAMDDIDIFAAQEQ